MFFKCAVTVTEVRVCAEQSRLLYLLFRRRSCKG